MAEGLVNASALGSASAAQLLATYNGVLKELRSRQVLRTNNAPAGDYAEWLVWRTLEAEGLADNSVKSHDLIDEKFGRVQVKAPAQCCCRWT